MPEVTRRRLLSSAAAGAGGVLASSILPPALARAAAEGPRKGSLRDVKHVVIHMQENRSFDHYFGTLGGVTGFGDPNVLIQTDTTPPFNTVQGRSVFYQYDQFNPDGYLLPWHLDTKATSSQAIPSTSHAWTFQHESLNITVPTTAGQPTTALNNNWIPSHFTADGAAHYWYVMGYYERQDIPFHFALAETFTLCDHYFCSLLGPTWPNRMFLWTGTIDPTGANGGPLTPHAVHLDDVPRAADPGRDQLADLPGGGRLRHQHARVLRGLPERQAGQPAVRGRADDLPAGSGCVGRQA